MDKSGPVYTKAKIASWLKIEYVMDCTISIQLHSHGLVKNRLVIEIQNQKKTFM